MKIKIHHQLSGNIMLACLIASAAVGAVLVAYLQLGQSSQKLSDRSQKWNLALPVAEAGLEEALSHLNTIGNASLVNNGWTLNSSGNLKGKGLTASTYVRTRSLGSNSFYEVGINFVGTKHRTNSITVVSSGYVRDSLSTNYISRTITGTIGLTNFVFTKAIIAKKHIRLGKGTLIDSFDSLSTSYSTKGDYDATKRKDNAGIATVSEKKNGIKIDKTKVYGDASTSHDGKGNKGDVEFKNNGTLGDTNWITAGNINGQPGKISHGYQYDFAEVKAPWTGGALPPIAGKVGKIDAQYVLGTGNYEVGKVDLKKPMVVTGNAVLYVTGDFKASEDIIILTNASLRLYMGGGKFEIKDKNVVLNDGDATQFQYYGLKSNKTLKIKKKGADLSGIIYAPNTKINIDGDSDIIGSIVGKCVHIKHNGQFHYDEAITKRPTEFDNYVLQNWTE